MAKNWINGEKNSSFCEKMAFWEKYTSTIFLHGNLIFGIKTKISKKPHFWLKINWFGTKMKFFDTKIKILEKRLECQTQK